MSKNELNPDRSLSEGYATRMAAVRYGDIPGTARKMVIDELLDACGLMVAAREQDYIRQVMNACDASGACTVPGQVRPLDAGGAALVNGTAIHGEDFDDTLDDSPVRVAATVIPAVMAAAERERLSGEDFLLGVAVGLETVCRLNRVAPGTIRDNGFHPTGAIGPFGAAAGTAAALGLSPRQMAAALGVAGSMSSGLMEYQTEEAWTKRLHPGWAAQAGYRAALLARRGFVAPRRVFEGKNGFFRAFAHGTDPVYTHLTQGAGQDWLLENICLKAHACGTLIHPYIDCMLELAAECPDQGDILEIRCETTARAARRIWEPLAAKQAPENGYEAKFSAPWCMAMAYHTGRAGLAQFSETNLADPSIACLSKKISHAAQTGSGNPGQHQGHIRVRLTNGEEREIRRSHLRGSRREPLTDDELLGKFHDNVAHGGWPESLGDGLAAFITGIPGLRDLDGLRRFRV